DEAKHRAALRVFKELLAHRSPQPVERLPHIHGLHRHVDPDRCRHREHQERSARTSAIKSATPPPRRTVPSARRTSSSWPAFGVDSAIVGTFTSAKRIALPGATEPARCIHPAKVV